MDHSNDKEIHGYYEHLRTLREIVIRKQNTSSKQLKLETFFQMQNTNYVTGSVQVSGGSRKRPPDELSDDVDDVPATPGLGERDVRESDSD